MDMLGVYTTAECCALVVHLLVVEVLREALMLTSPAGQPMHFGPQGETPDWAAEQVVVEIRLREMVQVPAQVATAALAA